MNPNHGDFSINFQDMSLDSYDPYNTQYYAHLLSQNVETQPTFGGESQSIDVPSFSTQPKIPRETKKKGRGRGRGRDAPEDNVTESTKIPRSMWGEVEDERLISAYVNTSKDPIVNTNQSGACFWKRVADLWNSTSPQDTRPRDSKCCKNRWNNISKNVSKFNGCFARASREKGSGESEDDVLVNAFTMYSETNEGKRFSDIHAWRLLCQQPKWSQFFLNKVNQNDPGSGSAASSKRSRSDMDSDTPNANTPTSEFTGHPMERPEGIKACKRKGKGKASATSDQEYEIRQEMNMQRQLMLDRAHELSRAKEERRNMKIAQYASLKSKEIEMEMEQKKMMMEMEREQKNQIMEMERKKMMMEMEREQKNQMMEQKKMEMEQKKMEMENEQNKRVAFKQKWDMLEFLMGQTNLGEEGETLKQSLMRELSGV